MAQITTPTLRQAMEEGTTRLQAHQATSGRELEKYMGRYGVVAPEYLQAMQGVQAQSTANRTADLHAKLAYQDLMARVWQEKLDRYYRSLKRQRKDERRSGIAAGLGGLASIFGQQLFAPQKTQGAFPWPGYSDTGGESIFQGG